MFGAALVWAAPPSRLASVQSWAYQLQGPRGGPYDRAALAKSPYDLLVIDHADQGEPLTKDQVAKIKLRPGGKPPRKLLAYMSIGEAEDYRFYWKNEWRRKPPLFLAAKNAEWHGNYKVRYWDENWQRLMLQYVEMIASAGFDGVYLDIIDAYEYFGPGGDRPERTTAAKDMCDLVTRIADHARTKLGKPDFAVVPQNGSLLLDEVEPEDAQRYLEAVDAIGAEDTYYFGDKEEDNPLDVQKDALAGLEKFRDAGRPVLAVDYLTKPDKAKDFVRRAKKDGFIPYVGRRALDRLVEQPAE